MRKSIVLWVVVAVALVLCSCKKEYKNAIPENSFIVAELGFANLALKADLPSQKDALKQALFLLAENQDDKNEIVEMINDPLAYGVDFVNPAYLFMLPDIEDPKVFLLFPLSDAKKTKSVIENDEDCEITESDGLAWIYNEGSLMGVISKSSMILGNSSNRSVYKELLEQDKNHSFFATDNGKLFQNNTGDITGFANLEVLPQSAKSSLKREIEKELRSEDLALPQTARALDALFESSILMNMQFEKGLVKSKTLLAGGITEMYKDTPAKAIDSKSMQYVSEEDLLGLVAFGVEGVAYWKYLETTVKASAAMYGLPEQMVATIENFINQLNGTAFAAVSARSLNDKDFKVIGELPVAKAEVINTVNAVQPGLADELRSYVAIDGNSEITIINSDKNYIFQPARNAFRYADNAKGQNFYVYLNVEKLTDLAYADEMKDNPYGISRSEEQVFEWLRLMKDAEIKTDKTNEIVSELTLLNGNKNSLAVIVEKGLSYLR